MYKSILVISSDEREKYGIFSRLSSSTTAVYVTSTVQEAMPYLTDQRLCLVILDAEISQKDNHTLLKSIKKLKTTPILVLSSQPGHAQRLETLKAGAHAYMGTPYTMEECLAQAQSLMQIYVDSHPEKHTYFTLAFGDNLVIDPSTRQVFIKDKEIKFTRKEFDLLFWLASNPGQVFSREQLYDHVWDEDSVYNVDDVVKAHIKALRRKLSDTDVAYIKNVWGIGYRFQNEPEDE